MRRAKIVATLGPATSSYEQIRAIIDAGVDVARMNLSHGSYDVHEGVYQNVRKAANDSGRAVAVLVDLQGPKIRLGKFKDGPHELAEGDIFKITTEEIKGTKEIVGTTFKGLPHDVKAGDHLLIDDGKVRVEVLETDGTVVTTKVIVAGPVSNNKGINLPGVAVNVPALSEKDESDLRWGLELGADLVALSFVRNASDIERVHEIMDEVGRRVPVIAKIEKPQAVDALEEITEAVDAVMVARGDLGLEMPLERVPRVQKDITQRARRHGIPVIVATQVLESMTVEPRPTRAEVNDAANAVDDGVDAIMLAGETAAGAYPARAVQTLDAIIRDAELIPRVETARRMSDSRHHDHAQALCEAALILANRGEAQAIVAVTRGGTTARRLSALRPHAPIIAATERGDTARRLALYWGVLPLRIELGENLEEASARVGVHLVERGDVPAGGPVVFVSISADLTRSDANYLKILRL